MAELPVLLLAAGRSERMGQVKPLLPWGTGTLIEHQIGVLLETGHPVFVMVGYQAGKIIPLIETYPVKIFMNDDWEKGMGSTISAGVKCVTADHPRARGILIALVDQPLIPAAHYISMSNLFQPLNAAIIATRSRGGLEGAPALFDESYFGELVTLQGKEGARIIIRKHRKNTRFLDCSEAGEDMDTPDAYRRLHDKYFS